MAKKVEKKEEVKEEVVVKKVEAKPNAVGGGIATPSRLAKD